MQTFNQIFPNIFCINLTHRTDRWEKAQQEFALHGISTERIEGVDGSKLDITHGTSRDGSPYTKGDIGCMLSHLKAVKLAKERNLGNYVVMEDDIEFHPQFNDLFAKFWQQMPANWHVIYASGTHRQKPIQITQNVYKIVYTLTTHFMIIRNTIYDAFIQIWTSRHDKVDIGCTELQKKYNFYVFNPHLAWQKYGYSDICSGYREHKQLKDFNYEK